jgi:biotin carboxylase
MTAQSPTRALLLGWSGPAAEALAAHGYDVTAVIDARHVGKVRGSGWTGPTVVVADTGVAEGVLAGVLRHGLGTGIDVVTTQSEFALVTAAMLGGVIGAAGMDLTTAVLLRDKFLQKQAVRRAGLPVTGCRTVDQLSDLTEPPRPPAAGVAWPVVVKPIAGAGSNDTFRLDGPGDVDRLLAAGRASVGPWLVEDFVDGYELHIDGVVRNGVIRFQSASRYVQNVIEIRNGGLVGSAMLDETTHRDLYARLTELNTAVLRALGHCDGVFHIEVFVHEDDSLTFSECAGRIGGGLVPEAVRHRYGVDLFDEWARALTGADPAVPAGTSTRLCGWVLLPAAHGLVLSMPDREQVLARPGVVQVRLVTRPGAVMPDVSAASNVKAGSVVVEGASTDEVQRRLVDVAAWFHRTTTVTAPALVP